VDEATPSSEALHRIAATLALAVGVGAALSPRTLLRIYGVDPDEMTEAGAFGWRLFAARNLVIGGAAFAGSESARNAMLAVQAPDQLVFLHAYRARALPRASAIAAMATSGAVIALGLAARRRD